MISLLLDCLKLTKAMQFSSEALQNVADVYDDHVGLILLHRVLRSDDIPMCRLEEHS